MHPAIIGAAWGLVSFAGLYMLLVFLNIVRGRATPPPAIEAILLFAGVGAALGVLL